MSARARILVLAVATLVPRLLYVQSPITGHHAWRQADTAAMARNFESEGFDLLHPQIDWGGAAAGHVESEFPIYSFAVAILYRLFGVADIWGRILSILCALVTVWALHRLVRENVNDGVAFWAALFYAVVPLNVYFARAVMPESPMLMASVLGILFFSRWLERGGLGRYLASAACLSLAALLKLPALYLGLPLVVLAWRRHGARSLTRPQLWVWAVLVLAPVFLWYAHAHAIYRESGLTFGIWSASTDKWGSLAPLSSPKFYNDVFFKSIAERHLTYAGFALVLIGLCLRRRSRSEGLFDWWLVAVLVYFGLVPVGNQVHDYYQLPFTLPAAVFAGKALHRFLARRPRGLASVAVLVLAVAVPVLSALRLGALYRKESRDTPLFRLAAAVAEHTRPGDLLIAVDRNDPIWLYRCNRKGWHANASDVTPEFLARRQAEGARFVVGPKSHFAGAESRLEALLQEHPVAADALDHFVVRLDP